MYWIGTRVGYFLTFIFLLYFKDVHCLEPPRLSPSDSQIDKSVNDSFIIGCYYPKLGNITWVKNGKPIFETKGRRYIGKTTVNNQAYISLSFEAVKSEDRGEYTCVVNDKNHNSNASFKLIVHRSLSFADTPLVQYANENSTAVIRCEVAGDPEPTVTWSVKRLQLVAPKYRVVADGLTINNVTRDDEGDYTCLAMQISSSISNVKEETIQVLVNFKPQWPEVNTTVYGYMSGQVNITCEVEARPMATFKWFKDNKQLKTSEYHNEENKSVLRVSINNKTVFRTYKCTASNKLGHLNRIFELKEGLKPGTPNYTEVHEAKDTSLHLNIKGPEWKELEITSYRVQVIEKNEKDKGRSWEHSREVELKNGEPFIITDLKPNTEYLLRVTAQNAAGPGDYTPALKTKTLAPSSDGSLLVPCFMLMISAVHIKLLS